MKVDDVFKLLMPTALAVGLVDVRSAKVEYESVLLALKYQP